MAETADKITSPSFPLGAVVRGSAAEFKARRAYQKAMAAFRDNMIDIAEQSRAFADRIHDFRRQVDAMAPTQADWDKAMEQSPETRQEARDLEAVGAGRSLL